MSVNKRIDLQVEFHVLVAFHDGGFVATPVAVVGRTENCNDVLVVGPSVPMHHQLVGASHSG